MSDDSGRDVACTLPEDELPARREAIREGIARRVTETREIDGGLAFRFPLTAESEAEVRAFVDFESSCCGFAEYGVRRDEATAALWLDIRGPEGTADFLRRMLATEPASARDAP